MSLANPDLRATKETLCVGDSQALEEGDEVRYRITVLNYGTAVGDTTLKDFIPEWVGTAVWLTSQGVSGTGPDIEIPVSVPPKGEFTLDITVTVAAPDACKGKTFTNVAYLCDDDPCTPDVEVCGETIFVGCEPVKFDPRVQGMDDRRAISILFDWTPAEWKQAVDRVNCGGSVLPPVEIDYEMICNMVVEKIEGQDIKGLIEECLEQEFNKDRIVAEMIEGITTP